MGKGKRVVNNDEYDTRTDSQQTRCGLYKYNNISKFVPHGSNYTGDKKGEDKASSDAYYGVIGGCHESPENACPSGFEYIGWAVGDRIGTTDYGGCWRPAWKKPSERPVCRRIVDHGLGNKVKCCAGKVDAKDCPRNLWGNNCKTPYDPYCDSIFVDYCDSGSRIFTNSYCRDWANAVNKDTDRLKEVLDLKQSYCTGENNNDRYKTTTCSNWCADMQNDTRSNSFQNYINRCNNNDYQQEYCKDTIRIIDDSEESDTRTSGFLRRLVKREQNTRNVQVADTFNKTICRDYCDENIFSNGSDEAGSDRKDWCRNKRKEYCAAKYDQYKNDPDKLSRFLSADTTTPEGEIGAKCGCYLPDEVYQAYVDKLKTGIATKDNFLDAHKECLFPACGTADTEFHPFNCPNIVLCSQNVDIDVGEGATIMGDVSSQSTQDCDYNSIAACQYDSPEWSECKDDGFRYRTRTLQSGPTDTCAAKVEEKEECVDCQYEYSEWSECDPDTLTQSRTKSSNVDGCESGTETRNCEPDEEEVGEGAGEGVGEATSLNWFQQFLVNIGLGFLVGVEGYQPSMTGSGGCIWMLLFVIVVFWFLSRLRR